MEKCLDLLAAAVDDTHGIALRLKCAPEKQGSVRLSSNTSSFICRAQRQPTPKCE